MIGRTDGAIHSLNILHRGALGLIEWSGEDRAGKRALLKPRFEIDGMPLESPGLQWERLERWLPRYRISLDDGLTILATICAPIGYEATRRGFFYHFEVENTSARPRDVRIALDGCWAATWQTAGERRHVAGEQRLARSRRRPGVALELAGSISAALGVAVFGADAASAAGADDPEIADSGAVARTGQRPFLFEVSRRIHVQAKRRGAVGFFCGIGPEREGALATAEAMRRTGTERLLKETRLELSRLSRKARDPALGGLLNRNLLFSYFFSLARGLDDERLYVVTSRSPLHPRCGTFNERDGLLWTLPAIALVDLPLARELLLRCFEQFSHRPGESVRYIDGGVLEPGFKLDQWCAYGLALDHYLSAAGDASIADEPLVHEVLRELENGFYARLHPEVFLSATELLPSDEPPDHPYVTYGNALLSVFCGVLEKLSAPDSEERKRAGTAAEELAAAVWRKCTVDVDGDAVLASSSDLEEAASVYDDPAGSLQWLPHYGFCDLHEPVWRNTVAFLRSPEYKLWLGAHAHPGLATRSAPEQAATSALCADLVGSRPAESLAVLRGLSFSAGVASTFYDPDNGQSTSGEHDAAVAGLLAWSLNLALNRDAPAAQEPMSPRARS